MEKNSNGEKWRAVMKEREEEMKLMRQQRSRNGEKRKPTVDLPLYRKYGSAL